MQDHEFANKLVKHRGTFSNMLKEALKENLSVSISEGAIKITYDGEDITEAVIEE